MRVLHIVSFYEQDVTKGGVARAAGLLARGQARIGANVTVFTTYSGLQEERLSPQRQNRGGVCVHYFPTRRRSRFFFSSWLLRACLARISEYDIVHIHGLWSFPVTWGALTARRADVPYILSPHGSMNEWSVRFRAYKKIPYWYAMEHRTVRRAAWVHFATEEEERQAKAWVVGKRTRVIAIGLDLQEFAASPPRGEFRERQRISRGVPLLTFLGRIHPIKGLDVLLRALVRVKAEVPEVILAIAGPDEDGHRGYLERLAQSLGVTEQVCWVGVVEESAKRGFLVDADLFVLPSFTENFGLAAVEAMAASCPVILGSGVNIAAQVQAGGAGWVVPTEPNTLASAILEALGDPDTRRVRGMAGQRLVAERYDGETVACEMLKGYEECLR
ncbi:MAG: glycosyltransferase [Candidatus Binatia bacterium]